jgi:hypothetical protein
MARLIYGAVYMPWKDIILLGVVVFGIVLFLYGANYYNALVGWTGGGLVFAGFLVEVVLKVYESFQKNKDA